MRRRSWDESAGGITVVQALHFHLQGSRGDGGSSQALQVPVLVLAEPHRGPPPPPASSAGLPAPSMGAFSASPGGCGRFLWLPRWASSDFLRRLALTF